MDEYASGAWFDGWTAPLRRPAGDPPVTPTRRRGS